MRRVAKWPILALSTVALASAAFQACVPGRYGLFCENVCACSEFEDCDEGPTGSGDCT